MRRTTRPGGAQWHLFYEDLVPHTVQPEQARPVRVVVEPAPLCRGDGDAAAR